jgi:hypothetical protein
VTFDALIRMMGYPARMVRRSLLLLSLGLLVPFAGCGPTVGGPGGGGSTTGSASGTSSASGAPATCAPAMEPPCWTICDEMVPATCENGEWMCPVEVVCEDCQGKPSVCDQCNPPVWECAPTAACLADCPASACLFCPPDGAPIPAPPGCTCTCEGGHLACAKP